MTEMGIDQLASLLGWYGKMPSSGDFVHRRCEPSLINGWHRWLSQGLVCMHGLTLPEAVREYRQAPVWNFLLPAWQDVGVIQMGSIAPSRDRVGREYPLVAVLQIPVASFNRQMVEGSARFYEYLGRQLFRAVSQGLSIAQFEQDIQHARVCLTPMLQRGAGRQTEPVSQGGDILAILNAGHEVPPLEKMDDEVSSWPGLSDYFNPYSHNSYWWTNQAGGSGQRTLVHGGSLNNILFTTLFANPSNIKRSSADASL